MTVGRSTILCLINLNIRALMPHVCASYVVNGGHYTPRASRQSRTLYSKRPTRMALTLVITPTPRNEINSSLHGCSTYDFTRADGSFRVHSTHSAAPAPVGTPSWYLTGTLNRESAT